MSAGLVVRAGCLLPPERSAGVCDVAMSKCSWCSNLRPVMHLHGEGRQRWNVCEPCLTRPFRTWEKGHVRRKRFTMMPPCGAYEGVFGLEAR